MVRGPYSTSGKAVLRYRDELDSNIVAVAESSHDARLLAEELNRLAKLAPKRLERRGPVKAKRTGKPRRVAPDIVRSDDYKARVRSLPCVVRGLYLSHPCVGEVEPSHVVTGAGQKGTSQKASDLQTVPKCHGHHQLWEDNAGPFKDWDKERRRKQAATWIRLTQIRLGVYERVAA